MTIDQIQNIVLPQIKGLYSWKLLELLVASKLERIP
jgi:hypothetical protein